MYFLALVCPPLAILLCGKPFQALFCLPLCCFYFPASLWAQLVVSNYKADQRHRESMGVARNQAENIARLGNIQIEALKLQRKADRRAELADVPVLPMPPAQTQIPQGQAPPAQSPAQIPGPPKEPIGVRLAAAYSMARESLTSAWSEGMRAYHNLPEWAQPICWGLAGGSVLSIPVALVFIFKG